MENQMSEQESLAIITNMINAAKAKLRKSDAFSFIFWGYLAVIASLSNYILDVVLGLYNYGYYSWFLMFAGMPISIYINIKQKRKEVVNTYVGSFIRDLWIALSVSIIVLALTGFKIAYLFCPLTVLIVAIGVFVTGTTFKFKPLIVGSIILWIAAGVMFLVPQDTMYLIYAVGLIAGYIIPGHIIQAKSHV